MAPFVLREDLLDESKIKAAHRAINNNMCWCATVHMKANLIRDQAVCSTFTGVCEGNYPNPSSSPVSCSD